MIKKYIALTNKTVEYTLKVSKRARRMSMAIFAGGDMVVTAPPTIPQGIIERFIVKKSKWVLSKIDYFKKFPAQLFKSKKVRRQEYLEHKAAALSLAQARIEHFNRHYEFQFNRVTIKNQKTRWGSCSKKGNINFNYRIALLQKELADYVVVHELCHLGQMNHSKKFWALVAETIPKHRELRRELKRVQLQR
ncbi:M48 family metallopeptidase [Candidatus Gracilibacteria bacterium]|nr:M48 family metallopeptidase [Candidatus Gracilibacteria bacterium]